MPRDRIKELVHDALEGDGSMRALYLGALPDVADSLDSGEALRMVVCLLRVLHRFRSNDVPLVCWAIDEILSRRATDRRTVKLIRYLENELGLLIIGTRSRRRRLRYARALDMLPRILARSGKRTDAPNR